ncbi:MAG: GNAT family N-acetyltransferase [Myxococcaceae bacterium]|nr:GNAT family N-acetyltransferase [Myxococcaceae bacterium]
MLLRPARPDEVHLAVAIDDDASELYAAAGLALRFPEEHPFVQAERARWLRCAENGSLWFAVEGDVVAGFAAIEHLDGTAHLEQLSVRRDFARRGIGAALLRHAIEEARGPLTLTTYAHVPWNAPWYARMGFVRLDETTLGPALRDRMTEERAVLPMPEQRVAMRRSVV